MFWAVLLIAFGLVMLGAGVYAIWIIWGDIPQHLLLQRQIGDKLLQPPVLILELLQSLGLINVETAILLAPAIKRLLRRSNFFAGSSDVLTLTLQHLDLPQLGDNLLST